jgi:hypothetical protein
MDSTVKIPIDLMQLPPFRQLRSLLGGTERALFLWWTLWTELGYRMQEGVSPGRLPAGDVPMLLAALEPLGGALEERKLLLEHLVTAKWLRADGADYVCPRFALLHGDAGAQRTIAQRGGDMKNFYQRQKKAQAQAFQQSLLIPPSRFVNEENQPLDSELTKRVMRVIVACDNALFRESRQPFGFTEGLISSALRVLRKHTDEEIDYVCRTVAKHRYHPVLSGVVTEKLLDQFGEMVAKLEGVSE